MGNQGGLLELARGLLERVWSRGRLLQNVGSISTSWWQRGFRRSGVRSRGGFAPGAFASNPGCLDGFGGLKNRRNGFLENTLSITRALNESTNLWERFSSDENIRLRFYLPLSPCKTNQNKRTTPGSVGQRPSNA
ncbi:hypothetical protein L3X38_025293 [Prunus dulcis]|uniref:Uncharacterized protein n=1 Tax=Prunus dulcis TaxID=3755 RepID=A0AAD4W1D7_PRUDU|nr:hypothetical protein L3X38_025293 [Prunus dulcis]